MPSSAAAACSTFGLWVSFLTSLQSDQVHEAIESIKSSPLDNAILPEYDFIVVGGGSGGSVVSSRLSQNPEWKVLLLEAGPPAVHLSDVPGMLAFAAPETSYNILTVPQSTMCSERGCNVIFGRGLGGTGIVNAMVYNRGEPRNYNEWAAMGNDGWSYEDVLPFFIKSEDAHITNECDRGYHGSGGLLSVSSSTFVPPYVEALMDGFREIGFNDVDYNGRNHQGVGYVQSTIRDGVRVTAYRAFIEPVMARPNLHVRTLKRVTKILLNADNTAVGVEIMDENNITRIAAASKEVVLSAGVIHSPYILMLSGIGPRSHLESLGIPVKQDLPVGDNLHDHVSVISTMSLAPPYNTPILETLVTDLTSFLNYNNRTGSMTSSYQLTAFDSSVGSPNISDIYFITATALDDNGCSYGRGYINPSVYNYIEIMVGLVRPTSRGTLRLRDTNPLSDPIIDPNYLSNEEEIAALIYGLRRATEAIESASTFNNEYVLVRRPLRGCEAYSFGTDDYWRCAIRTGAASGDHVVGTVQMAPRENGGVVDSRLRVYGVRRLRVVDASIMPKVTSGNTNAPTIMIGEMAAHMIAEDWQYKL